MNKLISLVAVAAFCVACGDDKKKPGGDASPDSPKTPDAFQPPAAPSVGPQLDRLGRPAINTALNHAFDLNATATGSAKDAYNMDASPGTWQTTWAPEFARNLAIIDALDSTINATGCGNQVLYNGQPGGGGSATATSYGTLAGILANDELYLDTSKGMCAFYLAVEFGVATGGGNSTCGGRSPTYDVIDFSYSALAAGLSGFNLTTFTPLVGDGVTAHTDISTTFPFLGTPH